MLLQPYVYPEYKFSDKIDYTKPIPPHLLYEEARQLNQATNSALKKVNHLALLAQTCNKYSQEFDTIVSTIPNLTSPSNQSNSSSCYATLPHVNQNNNEDMCQFSKNANKKCKNVLGYDHNDPDVTKKSLKLKKKLKKTKKALKKKSKKNESQVEEAETSINNKDQKPLEINIKSISNELNLPSIKTSLSTNVNNSEIKNQRFKPYERQKLYAIHHDSNVNRTCNWLVNGKICGLNFRKNDEFNEHIKLHTTNELFTDLTFYYNTKKLLTKNTSQEMCL